MKICKNVLIIFLSFFTFNLFVYAEDSKLEPTISVQFNENEANILLGYKGEELNDITNTIAYDSRYFELSGFGPQEDFVIREEHVSSDGHWHILNYSLVSENFYKNTNYAILTLKLKSKLKKGDIYFYDYLGISAADKYRYRNNGMKVTVKKEFDEWVYVSEKNTKQTKIIYQIKEITPYVATGIFALILVFVIYLIIPSKVKKENRKNKINEKIVYSNNVIIGERKHSKDVEEVKENVELKTEDKLEKKVSNNNEDLILLNPVDFGDKNEENSNN